MGIDDAAREAGLNVLKKARSNLGAHLTRFLPADHELMERVTLRATRQAAEDLLAGEKDDDAWLQIDAQLKGVEVAVAIPVKGLVRKTVLDAISELFMDGINFLKPMLGELVKKATGE